MWDNSYAFVFYGFYIIYRKWINMKNVIQITSLCILTFWNVNCVQAQTSDPYIEFLYDASGNRTSRKVVTLNRSMEFPSDTIQYIQSDSTTVAERDTADVLPGQNGADATQIITDNIGGMEIKVYPNPTSGMLSVQITPFPEGQKAEIALFDFANKLLFKTACNAEYTRMDLSSYTAGTYLMYVTINGRVSNWKIVKQ